jgi:hypothetical protein
MVHRWGGGSAARGRLEPRQASMTPADAQALTREAGPLSPQCWMRDLWTLSQLTRTEALMQSEGRLGWMSKLRLSKSESER